MLQGKRILIVEDETLIAMVLEDILGDLGCEVVASCSSVTRALQVVDSGTKIDAAILDIELNEEKSWPVAAALTARGVPFTFSTGHGADAQIDSPFAAAPVLEKPFDEEGLTRILVQLLGASSPSV